MELPATLSRPRTTGPSFRYAGDDTPLDGVEELTVALHDNRRRRVRPALAWLAKIGGAAE
jgi:hypothetical protein